MSRISCPHDKLFKGAMTDIRVARDFFQHYLPEKVLKEIDLNTLSISKSSYVDPELELTHSDVLYEVMVSGEIGYLYLLCEHQSTIDLLMPFRLWRYIVSIWDDYLKQNGGKILPLVIPIVFYHGKSPYTGPTDIRDLIVAPAHLIEALLFKPFHLIDTHQIKDETLREQEWAGVMAFTMKHIHKRNFLILIESIQEWFFKTFVEHYITESD